MQHLFQTVSAVEWDYFKILPQANAPSFVETIRTLYGPKLSQELSPDVEMIVDELLVVKEAPFTTVTNKKSKGKKRPSSSTNTPVPSQNMPPPVLVVSRAPPPSQPATMATVKLTSMKVDCSTQHTGQAH